MARFVAHLRPGARVLDLGCGPGQDTAWLAEQGYVTTGIDLSGGMLREASRRGVNAPLIQADLRQLPFRSSSYQGLWACASLLHIPKAQAGAAVREMARVVNPGTIYIAVKRGTGEAWVKDEDGKQRFFAYYEPDELRVLVREAGCTVLSWWQTEDSAGRSRPWINLLARSGDQDAGL
jgi:ubiquinone/menaquinone biosynthesis C-methylase UbiE